LVARGVCCLGRALQARQVMLQLLLPTHVMLVRSYSSC
jgi:hypothetical protein